MWKNVKIDKNSISYEERKDTFFQNNTNSSNIVNSNILSFSLSNENDNKKEYYSRLASDLSYVEQLEKYRQSKEYNKKKQPKGIGGFLVFINFLCSF